MTLTEINEFYQGCLNVDDLFKFCEPEANYINRSSDDTLRTAEFDEFLIVFGVGSYEVFFTTSYPGEGVMK